MSGDIVDGASVRASNDRTGFTWRRLLAVLMVVLALVLGVASMVGEWSRVVLHRSVTLPEGATLPRGMVVVLGPITLIYVGLFGVLVVMTALRLVSLRPAESTTVPERGLFLTVLLLMLLGWIALGVGSEHPFEVFEYYSSGYSYPQVLGWGVYAAFGGVGALGVAQLLLWPNSRTR